MPVLEIRDVQNPVVRWAKEHGILCVRVTPKGDKGWPDCIFVIPSTGRVIWMEFKAPGKQPEPIQTYRHRQLKEAKQHVYLVDEKSVGISILKAELEPPRLPEESDENAPGAPVGRFVPRPRTWED
jgi:hypothetical protein